MEAKRIFWCAVVIAALPFSESHAATSSGHSRDNDTLNTGCFRVGLDEYLFGYSFGRSKTENEGGSSIVRRHDFNLGAPLLGYLPEVTLGYRIDDAWILGTRLYFGFRRSDSDNEQNAGDPIGLGSGGTVLSF